VGLNIYIKVLYNKEKHQRTMPPVAHPMLYGFVFFNTHLALDENRPVQIMQAGGD
jgi:hypothetical protein